MPVRFEPFGMFGDRQVNAYVLTSDRARLSLIEYGARLRECFVPDAKGRMADVALGFDTLEDYVAIGGSTGAICGRYGNRIAGARFELGGRRYELSANEPPNHLHGGFEQFARRLWRGEGLPSGNAVRFTLVSLDGGEGYPGNLHAEVTYALEDGPALRISMRVTSDRDTYVNLIFHGYWNLGGHASGPVDGQLLQVAAERYLPVLPDKIPTGEFRAVAGTPFDFRRPKAIGAGIAAVAPGYDHNLCLDDYVSGQLRPVLRMVDPKSGRAMTLATDQPGVQFYTANQWAKPVSAKGGETYAVHQGAAFETQAFPNTPNTPSFGPRPLRRDETYRHEMLISFSAVPPPETARFFDTPWR
jgi:aldose 1-epimerase